MLLSATGLFAVRKPRHHGTMPCQISCILNTKPTQTRCVYLHKHPNHFVQGPKKWFAKCDKHYPSRFRQTSLATAVANFTKPCTSHFFGLCSYYIPAGSFGANFWTRSFGTVQSVISWPSFIAVFRRVFYFFFASECTSEFDGYL